MPLRLSHIWNRPRYLRYLVTISPIKSCYLCVSGPIASLPDGDGSYSVPSATVPRLPPGRQPGPVEGDRPGVPQVEHGQHEAGGEAEEELGEDHARHHRLRDHQQRLEDGSDKRHGADNHYNVLDRVTELAA